ncbi:ABC transporter permease [Pseudolactococcus yaeyamensis]
MTNFALIFRNLIKKDWKKLSVTLLGLVYFAIFYAPMMQDIYSTKSELLAMFETLKNPAMIALVGPTEATAQTVTMASFYFQEMTLFTALIFIIVGILHILSRTRAEEEEGLSELILSFPVGKLTQPVAVLLEMTGFYLTSGILITAGLTFVTKTSDGFNLTANALYGFSLALSGLLFSVLALLIAQLFATASAARNVTFSLLGALYIARAFTDLSSSTLSRLNPLAWVYLTSPSVGNHGFYLLALLLLVGCLSLVTLNLQKRRDLSGSIFSEKEKRYRASRFYSSILGFVAKNAQGQLMIWGSGLLIMGATYGSIFGDIDKFVKTNATFKAMFVENPKFNLAEQFMGTILMVLIVLATVPVISLTGRLAKDERLGRLDLLLLKTSRIKLLWSTWGIAVLVGIIVAELGGLGLYLASAVVMAHPISLVTVLTATTAYLPTLFIFASLAIFLIAIHRKLLDLAWLYLIASFIIDYLGSLMKLGKIFHQLTPFYWVPRLPVDQMDWRYVGAMGMLTLALLGMSSLIYQKRDI